jgi:hypothetical protein
MVTLNGIISNRPAKKGQVAGSAFAHNRVFDAIEIGSVRLPVIGIAGDLDVFVRLELDKFEWAGADRVLPHLARRHMAGIDRRPPGGQQRQQIGLRLLELEADLEVTPGGYFGNIVIP